MIGTDRVTRMHTTPAMTGIPKGTRPLSAAHIELIRLLAKVAVERYLEQCADSNEACANLEAPQ